MLFLLAALAFTAVWPSATALKNLTSTGCADASGFQTCQDAANTKISACLSQTAGSTEEEEGCACEDYILNYNCYATHCWNRVWECDYQEYMASYMLNCPTAKFPVPYFPAEDGVPDACSCNLGKVYQAITDAIDQGATCLKHANSDFNTVEFGACQCCEISGAIIYEICPDTNPSLVGIQYVSQIQTELDFSFADCQSMTQINCATDLGYSLPGVSTYYPPQGFPASGTATLSNKPGSVTAPPSGTVFSYTNGGDSAVYTITAAAAGGNDKSSSKASEGSESSVSTATSSGASSAAQTGHSGKDSAAHHSTVDHCLIATIVIASVLASWMSQA